MSQHHDIPQPPKITDEDLRKCRESGDYCPVLFEWYKFVGGLCNFFASICQDSLAVRKVEPLHYAVLVGLLNRCSRLMLANVALSHKGLFGETTALIDRCIFESCVKIAWLCHKNTADDFTRFIADGLKTELELKAKIKSIIATREHHGVLEIEKRMLASIDRAIASSNLTEPQIAEAKKLPDLAAMIEGMGQDRLMYIVGQKLGSHHVHGTWPSLRMHYLEQNDEGILRPRDHDCATHADQYISILFALLDAMKAYIRFIFSSKDDIAPMERLIESIDTEIMKLNEEVVGDDLLLLKKYNP